MKKYISLIVFISACGSSYVATQPPQGEVAVVAEMVSNLFPQGHKNIALDKMMNTNINFVGNRFEHCPQGSHACYTEPNIYLEKQNNFYTECFLIVHEFLHVSLGAITGDNDKNHVGLNGNGESDYKQMSENICAIYKVNDAKK